MKPSQFFLLLGIVILLLQISCDKSTEPDETSPPPIVAIYPSSDYINFPDSIRALYDGTKVHMRGTILLPDNCPVSFAIANVGPKGSILNYTVADDGALGGFLDYTNGVGSLADSQYATITVSADPRFTGTGLGGLVGSTLVLSVYTPKASNYTRTPVSIDVRDFSDETQKLCGIWSGTWSGNTLASGYPGTSKPTLPVGGTWTLNLQSVDLAHQTASGTLTWNGTDAFWTYTFDDIGNVLGSIPIPFIVNRTITINSVNTILKLQNPPCERMFSLFITAPHNLMNPLTYVWTDADYLCGVDFRMSSSGAFIAEQSNWLAHPYDPSHLHFSGHSNGGLRGSKSQ